MLFVEIKNLSTFLSECFAKRKISLEGDYVKRGPNSVDPSFHKVHLPD